MNEAYNQAIAIDPTTPNTPAPPIQPYKLAQRVVSTKVKTLWPFQYQPSKKAPSRRDLHRMEVASRKG